MKLNFIFVLLNICLWIFLVVVAGYVVYLVIKALRKYTRSARGDYTSVEALTENCVLPESVSPKGGVKRFRRSARQYVCASDGAYVEYVIPCVLAARHMTFERGIHDVDAHFRS